MNIVNSLDRNSLARREQYFSWGFEVLIWEHRELLFKLLLNTKCAELIAWIVVDMIVGFFGCSKGVFLWEYWGV